MTAKQKTAYRWQVGDLISPLEAAQICGYKSPKKFQDPLQRRTFDYEFTVIRQGDRLFFLRSEIDDYLTKLFERAKAQKNGAR